MMEVRAGGQVKADSGVLIGHAAVFNSRSLDLGGFVEVIEPGAFEKSINTDIRALIDHQGIAIAREANGTLRVSEDELGLRVEIDLPDTTAGNDIRKSVERGDIDGMSFGFYVREGGERVERKDGVLVRTLTDLDIHEVSIVTFPAYPDTDIARRSVLAWQEVNGMASLAKAAQMRRKRLNQLLKTKVN